MKIGSLCTGYGGIEMGLTLASVDVDLRWIAEVEPALAALHATPNLGDITAIDWGVVEQVDMITAGFPCQPTSSAGRQLGDADPRWLWPAVRRAINALLPSQVLLENVRNLVSYDKGRLWTGILDDLTDLGYDVRWLTLGACHVGAAHHRHRVFALATLGGPHGRIVERVPTTACGAKDVNVLPSPAASAYGSNQGGAAGRVGPVRHSLDSMARLDLLPSPAARDGDGRGEGDPTYWANRGAERHSVGPLGAAVTLLPSPTASDHTGAGQAATRDGGANLRTTVTLLPTPRATDGVNGGPGQRGVSGDLAMSSAVQPENWGRFGAAVARQAALFGPPPAPTEPNRNGAPRLGQSFAEWLMCIPAGHVTAHLPRTAALKAIGNGVCPPQLAAAYRLLTSPIDNLVGSGAMTTTPATNVKFIQDRTADTRRIVLETHDQGILEMDHFDSIVGARALEAALHVLADAWEAEATAVETNRRRGHVAEAKDLRAAAGRLHTFATGLTNFAAKDEADQARRSAVEAQQAARRDAMGPLTSTLPILQGPVIAGSFGPGDKQPTTMPAMDGGPPVPALNIGDTVTPINPDPWAADDERLATNLAAPVPPPATLLDFISGASDVDPATIKDDAMTFLNATVTGGYQTTDLRTPTSANPFIAPPARPTVAPPLTYLQIENLPSQLTQRDYLSHSFVSGYEQCSLKVLLARAARAGLIPAERPGWALVGGNAFHAAIEAVELGILAGEDVTRGNVEMFWSEHLEATILTTTVGNMAGSPWADPRTWYAADRGKEGYDWWRVEGGDMVRRYLDYHNGARRQRHKILHLVSDVGPAPVIELEFMMDVDGVDDKGYIDQAWIDLQDNAITLTDLKSGKSKPAEMIQLGEYAHVLNRQYGVPGPIFGSYWMARTGEYTAPVDLLTVFPWDELSYRFRSAQRGNDAGVFVPNVSNFCVSCGVRASCPAGSR